MMSQYDRYKFLNSGQQKQNLYVCVADTDNDKNDSSAELEDEESETSINEDETNQINSMLLN